MLQLGVCLSKIDLDQDIPILVENDVELLMLGDDLFRDAPDERLLEIRRAFENAGIKVHSVHAPFGVEDSLIALNSKARKQAVGKFKRLLSHLSVAGVENMVFHIGKVEDEKHQSSAFSIATESLFDLVKSAEEHRVILALENIPPESSFPRGLCSNSEELLRLLRKVNSPWLKACFDTGHAHLGEKKGEKIADWIRNLNNWIGTIHMHDNGGDADRHLQPGYGTINWDDFVRALQDVGYDGPLIVECEPWGGATIKRMLDEVKALLKDAGADIPEELTLRPKADWLKNFPSGWTNPDIMIRCRRCGHYIVWTPEGGHCACG